MGVIGELGVKLGVIISEEQQTTDSQLRSSSWVLHAQTHTKTTHWRSRRTTAERAYLLLYASGVAVGILPAWSGHNQERWDTAVDRALTNVEVAVNLRPLLEATNTSTQIRDRKSEVEEHFAMKHSSPEKTGCTCADCI